MSTEAPQQTIIPVDTVNEQVVIAAALVSTMQADALLRRLQPSHFALPEHQTAWTMVAEMRRRGLDFDPATVQALTAGRADVDYLAQLAALRPEVPPNLDYHVQGLMWDHARIEAARGPLAALLGALKDASTAPERVRALSQQLAASFDGYQDRQHLLDPGLLVREQSAEITERMTGRHWPFGLAGLDLDAEGQPRLTIGSKPGHTTVVTGISGAGKSTLTAHLILGLARNRRRVLVGAWEMNAGITLELLATLSLGFSRTAVMLGRITPEQKAQLDERMALIARHVRFLANPFRRRRTSSVAARGERPSNERNLDLIAGYVADSGCDVWVADLWKRCLASSRPEDEEWALYEQQAIHEELHVHGILVQQQRNKDIEQRQDKRPTREGITGSGAWVQVADNIFGANRPALWKPVDDNVFELHLLKQRYGKWPQLIEFDWSPARGSIEGGTTRPYDFAGEQAEGEGILKNFERPKGRRGR